MIEIKMSTSGNTGVKRTTANYSNCPLKKRPIKYEMEDHIDSDSSNSNDRPTSHHLMDISEPENLSTKPQDLRISGITKPLVVPTPTKIEIIHSISPPPPIGLITGHRGVDLPPSPSASAHREHPLPYSPSDYSSPSPYVPHFSPTLKVSGPLEPISLNAPAIWPHVPSYLHFNYNSRHQQHPSQHLFSPPVPTYPKPHVTEPNFNNPHNMTSPLFRESPPHISPLLKPVDPTTYSILKRDVLSLSEMNNILHTENSDKVITIKRERDEPCRYSSSSPVHHHRESVISHSHTNQNHHYGILTNHLPYTTYNNHHHRDSMSSSRSSCDSGVSSPTSSSSHSTTSTSSITPTNVNGSVRYQCPNCNKSYSTFSGLSKHLQFHCASQNKKSFICKFCDKVYVSLGALKMHIRTHTLPCKCDLCGKAFSRPWLLQGHIRTHTGEKPFACQHCNRAFADRSNLRAHLQTHSEVKKYSCKNCSKTFSRMSLLVKHEDSGCNSSPLHST